jgi:hypothetical protein
VRVIRKQVIFTTVLDKDIHDKEILIRILKDLSENSTTFRIEYRDERSQSIASYEKVIINKVHDDSVKIQTIGNKASYSIDGIKISDIQTIIITTEHYHIPTPEESTGFEYLDIVQEEEKS